MPTPRQFQIDATPVADPQAVVQHGNYRFTLLTNRLIRIEYSPTAEFVDAPSQIVWYRRQPVPAFTLTDAGDSVIIGTDALALTCDTTQPPSPQTLTIKLQATDTVWHYGDDDPENLRGSLRTVDEIDGPAPLETGLMSRAGWALIRDESLLFTDDHWVQARSGDYIDLYFFGYGHDYKTCLRDYLRIAGQVPLIPRWALGNWWSRYHAYTQDELTQLINDFDAQRIPLSVLIIDMDWHITQTGNASSGWTGYTWNKQLFPNPDALLSYAHQRNLKVSLNLHPADGVWPHEAAYKKLAQRLGHDTSQGAPVQFDIGNRDYAQAYFEELHHPLEARGVDFWWMDWQQGYDSGIPGLDPLWWLNHLHAYDIARDGRKRRFVFSRWGGLGNHRYPIGFSGDSVISWASLDFQPYLTATSANVGFGWWSHDIGGHYKGTDDPELFTRWLQYGVFSPILRLHTTKNDMMDRRPWQFDPPYREAIAAALRLRHQLVPYLYTAARKFTDEGVPPVRPMYYEHPEEEAAYACPQQYYFGDLIAAPFTQPANPDTRLSRQVVWLPEGDWYDFFSGQHYVGGRWHVIYGTLQDIPVFAQAGTLVPLNADDQSNGTPNPDTLQLRVFGNVAANYTLYEDDGESTAYRNGEASTTLVRRSLSNGQSKIEVDKAVGGKAHLPKKRQWQVAEPTKSAIPNKDERLTQILRRLRLPNDMKQVMYQQGAHHDMQCLLDFAPWLSAAQRRVLLETYYDAGVHVTRDKHYHEEIVIWNNHEADLHYRFAVMAHFQASWHETGEVSLGGMRILRPQQAQSWHYNVAMREGLGWQLTITYPNGMTVTEMGAGAMPRLPYDDDWSRR